MVKQYKQNVNIPYVKGQREYVAKKNTKLGPTQLKKILLCITPWSTTFCW